MPYRYNFLAAANFDTIKEKKIESCISSEKNNSSGIFKALFIYNKVILAITHFLKKKHTLDFDSVERNF